LPEFQVNKILHIAGSSPVQLFAATDVGVFYKAGNNDWSCFTQGMPVTLVTDLDINYTKGKLRASTFGRGMWESDLPCDGYTDWLITSNTIWDSHKRINGNIQIMSGYVLTINNGAIISMGEESTIIVHPGAQLIIDGATINSGCGSTWQGIEVWGDPTKSQDLRDVNGLLVHQGEVIIKNGGTISNADIAIMAMKRKQDGDFTWQDGGGIIKAVDANFINNRGGIWIGGYHPPMIGGNGPMPYNKSSITNCHFETNDDLPEGMNFHWFVGLCSGSGITIKGNDFVNLASAGPQNKRGTGIGSFDFPISVRSICADPTQNPCTALDSNRFEGLFYGIEIYDTKTWVAHTIKDSRFKNVRRGIYLGNTHSTQVLGNYFEDIPGDVSYEPYGLYIDGGNGFTIEGDTFVSAPGLSHARGLIVHNTGGNDNEIYRNDFQNLLAGVQAQEVNKDNNGRGLRFFCNTHVNRYYDFWVGDKFNSSNSPIGIADAQQMPSGVSSPLYYPTGNVFTSGPRFGDLNFSNGQAEWLTYNYYGNSSDEDPGIYHSGINPIPKYDENTCPAKATGGGGTSLGQLYASRATAKVALNSSTLILNIWKDGGHLDLAEEIETTLPWEAYVEFNDLMGQSPYLSDEALIAIVNNPVFSSLMVKLLMVANPQSSRSDAVMNAIYDRNPPLSQSYIDEIVGELETISQLEMLEADMAADRHLFTNLGEQIKRWYRSDTTNVWANDSLLSFMSRDQRLASRYEYAAAQLEFGYPEAATQTLEDILSNFELTDVQYEDHQKFTTLMGLKQSMMQSEQPVGFLDEGEMDELMDLVEANRPQVSAAAVALLKQNDPDFVYDEIVLEPDTNSVPKRERVTIDKEPEKDLRLYPNPAYDYITVSCNLDQYVQSGYKLQLYNALGQLLYERALSNDNSEMLIPLGEYPAGNYHFILVGDGQHLANEKFTIIR
jgi:hypothetical protein